MDEPELFFSSGRRIFDHDNHQFSIAKFGDQRFDTAAIQIISTKQIIGLNQLLPLTKSSTILERGTEIGWLGYPAMADTELCFFHGYISYYDKKNKRYLVDGSVSLGVSGWPAFTKEGLLVGLVSAYVNLPGPNTKTPSLTSLVSLESVRSALENDIYTEIISPNRDTTN